MELIMIFNNLLIVTICKFYLEEETRVSFQSKLQQQTLITEEKYGDLD